MGFNFTFYLSLSSDLRLTRGNVSGFPWAGFLEPFYSQVGEISLGQICVGQNWILLNSEIHGPWG